MSPRFRLGVLKGLDSYFASKRMNSGSGKSDSRGLAIETAPHGRTESSRLYGSMVFILESFW